MVKKYLKNRILIIILLLVVFCIFNLFLSYSYYIATVINNESNTTDSIQSSGVVIVYENNSGYLEGKDFAPGAKLTKQFSISSNSKSTDYDNESSKIWYNIRLVVEENTFSDNVIVCSLAVDSSSTSIGQTATDFTNKGIASGQNIEGMTLGSGYIVYGDVKHVYNLTIEYPKSEIYEVNKTINAHVIVEVVGTINLNIDLDGGNFPSGASINRVYGNNAIALLEVPTKENYEHIGWEIISGNASLNGNEITLSNGDVSVKALWKATVPPAKSFAEDSWETIAYYAKHPVNDRTPYEVGQTKTITLKSLDSNLNNKNVTLRIVNNSNFDCILESNTSCGFVVEFADIPIKYNMNTSDTNVGGWPKTSLYSYLGNTLFNALPEQLRQVIINTVVISGHGNSDFNSERADGNWTSNDKLYLFNTKEIWKNCSGGTNDAVGCWDSSSLDTITRQLDYYADLNVSTSSYNCFAIKYFNGSPQWYWLRSAYLNHHIAFNGVNDTGIRHDNYPYTNSQGVSVAFRIGEQPNNYFENDSWATIAANIVNGTAKTRYRVGELKSITLKSSDSNLNEKTVNLRIVNNSNYECNLESKTACGFVVQFADPIISLRMNATATNIKGWPNSEIRAYLNSTLFYSLPDDLSSSINKTYVISGHGNGDSNSNRADGNWTSEDFLFLLSTKEVWQSCNNGTSNDAGCYDSASLDSITRQLDYYSDGVSSSLSNNNVADKYYYGSRVNWWLRSSLSNYSDSFSVVRVGGFRGNRDSNHPEGIAPAFRLG